MDTHKNAPLTPKGREMMVRAVVDCGLSKAAAAGQFNVTPKTVAKWGQTLPRQRHRRFARPLVSSSFIAEPNGARHSGGD
jgi:transposase-like protein